MERTERTAVQRGIIIAQARRLFWEDGYSKTSMRDLARACNFEVSNIYNYFKNKEEILYQLLFEQFNYVLSSLQRFELDDNSCPTEELRSFISSQLHLNLVDEQYALIQNAELRNLTPSHRKRIIQLRDRYERILRKIIQKGTAAGVFKETDIRIIGRCIILMVSYTRNWFSSTGELSIGEIGEVMSNFVLDGLRKREERTERVESVT